MINADVALNPVTRTEALSKITGSGNPVVKLENKKFPEEEKKEYSKEDVQAAVDRTNKLLSENNITHLKFEIHEGTGSLMVKVVDNSTDEVIKEIPSEKLLDYAAGMWELAGIIVDEKG
jgi:flagellar protein FlaG